MSVRSVLRHFLTINITSRMGRDSFNVGGTDKLLQRFIAICCCVLMFSDVAGVSSVQKFAYIGQAAKLFYIDNDYAEPSLYNETETLIASWNTNTNTVAHMNPRYSGKIYMDKERNIWMFDVERKDAGRYYVKFGAKLEQHEVDIILTVKGSHDSIFLLLITIMILVIIIFVILIIIIVLMYKKLCSEPKQSSESQEYTAVPTKGSEKLCSEPKQSSESHEYTAVPTKGSELTEHRVQNWLDGHPEFVKKYNATKPTLKELGVTLCGPGSGTEDNQGQLESSQGDIMYITFSSRSSELPKEDQVHKWLNDHPDVMDKYLGKLTEDQICKQIHKWDDAYPGLLNNKYLDAHENDQVVTPTLEELSITLKQHSGTGIEGNPNQSVSTQVMFHASQHSDVTCCGPGTRTEDNQVHFSTRRPSKTRQYIQRIRWHHE